MHAIIKTISSRLKFSRSSFLRGEEKRGKSSSLDSNFIGTMQGVKITNENVLLLKNK